MMLSEPKTFLVVSGGMAPYCSPHTHMCMFINCGSFHFLCYSFIPYLGVQGDLVSGLIMRIARVTIGYSRVVINLRTKSP